MTKPMIQVHNVETNAITEREMSDSEYTQWQKDQADELARQAAKAEAETKKQVLLDRLGITQEEAVLLLS
jgi:predicted metal-binding transcription factor (methanogenesis marker protein 9)